MQEEIKCPQCGGNKFSDREIIHINVCIVEAYI